LTGHRLNLALAFALLVAAGGGLSACGRAGPPELPTPPAAAVPAPAGTGSAQGPSAAATPPTPGSAAPTTTASAAPGAPVKGFDAHGNPVAPPGEKKSFLLDPLLQ
jgi:hypothetical protein